MSIKCPICRRNMKRIEEKNRIVWDCTNCKKLFIITQLEWYPIKEAEGE